MKLFKKKKSEAETRYFSKRRYITPHSELFQRQQQRTV